MSEDEFTWRQVKDPRGVYVHSHPAHVYPGLRAWNPVACASGAHPGCEVSELPPVSALWDVLQACLEERDMVGVGHVLRLIAVQDPQRAQLLMDTMKVGIAINKERRP